MIDQTTYAQWVGAAVSEYRLTRLLSVSPMGPLYTADTENTTSTSTYLIRVLTVPPAQTSEMMRNYQEILERQAEHIMALRHPYMLPLVSYGIANGLPYFVWPYTSMRSLNTRLSQSGVLDVVTMGRYLDQIAATLEYAHQNATYHRNLSVDCIYLQMDGQIAVGDFGVRRLYELLTPGSQVGFFSGSLEALAPEQLTGGQINAYTDVYALGAVTYRLLTGQPVFNGDNFRAVAEQHLHAEPPPLARARTGIPIALDRVLADALAKDPVQRIQRPGAFADAYQRVVAPANALRVPFDAPGGNGATSSQSGPTQQALPRRGANSATLLPQAPGVKAGRAGSPSGPTDIDGGSSAAAGWRQFISRSWWFLLIALVLAPLITAGALFLANNHQAAAKPPSGTLLFVDSASTPTGSDDGFRITASGLPALPSGSRYEVWFINQETEQIIALGQLAPGENQTYQLAYTPGGLNNTSAANVLTEGDMIEITQEQSNVVAPSGHMVLAVKFPPQSFVHIKHLLLSFPTTPGKIGLLVGVLRQTQLLNAQASALNTASSKENTALVRCLAQSIIDISEGSSGEHYKPLSAGCRALGVTQAGDGFGLLSPVQAATPGSNSNGSDYNGESGAAGYIKNAANHASLATATSDATEDLRQHARPVQDALADVSKSVTTADNAALALLTAPTDTSVVAKVVAAAGAAYQGTDASKPGGAIAAYLQGQLMATLPLTQPAA
jgi:serine/threonine protein kinase